MFEYRKSEERLYTSKAWRSRNLILFLFFYSRNMTSVTACIVLATFFVITSKLTVTRLMNTYQIIFIRPENIELRMRDVLGSTIKTVPLFLFRWGFHVSVLPENEGLLHTVEIRRVSEQLAYISKIVIETWHLKNQDTTRNRFLLFIAEPEEDNPART